MARSDVTPRRPVTILYRDANGQVTADPAEAASGEVVHVDPHGSARRIRFFLQREDLPWLPVSEPAFLLWVLLALVLAWVVIGLFLVLV